MKKKVVILGAGGHAKVICDIIKKCDRYDIAGLIDFNKKIKFMGLNVMGTDFDLEQLFYSGIIQDAVIAVGDNGLRQKLAIKVCDIGYNLVSVISPDAIISPYAVLETGVTIMPGAVINAYARIGRGSVINTKASIDHETTIGEFCHIAPGCSICGKVSIGNNTFIGVGASVIDQISIGESVMVGAGAVVIKSLPDNCEAVGVPARIIKNLKNKNSK